VSVFVFINLAKVNQLQLAMQIRTITFLLFTLFIALSCSKDAKNQRPVVNFIKPLGDEALFSRVKDTVLFRVSDDQLVKAVGISFVNEELIAMNQTVWFDINSKDTVIQYIMNLNGVDVDKGYILVRAEDGTHSKLKYQPVILNDEPLPIEKIVHGFRLENETKIGLFEPAIGMNTDLGSIDYSLSTITGNGEDELLLCWPENRRFVEVWSVNSFKPLWRLEAAFPQPEYHDFFLRADRLLLADRNGNLRLHQFHTGNVLINANLESSKLINAIAFDELYLYAAVQDLQTSKYWLMCFFRASGVFYKRFELEFKAMDMLPLFNKNGVMIFATDAQETTKLFQFNATSEIIVLEEVFPDFAFVPPVISQNEMFFLQNQRQIIGWSSESQQSRIFAEGTDIKGMVSSPTLIDRIYYIDNTAIYQTNNAGVEVFLFDEPANLIALIIE